MISGEKVREMSTLEVTGCVKKLKPKRSSGFDLISNYMIKLLPSSYIGRLTKCFNVWLSECWYPDEWKLVKMVTLNKLKADVPRCD